MPQFNGSMREISSANINYVGTEWNIYASVLYTFSESSLLCDKQNFLFISSLDIYDNRGMCVTSHWLKS